ncbi:Ca2+-transporting ATPase [Filimonas lacunae]|uniref:Ca2+-transporting ATPase n=1 Tax=Filimonas lacunae TaxID=477680 RepID=A0A173MHH2_9BACT|nr:cation-translocating P-type ATPase [Filimonas lacunae]BAV06868.1 cation transport ATPase [Filimonas lacunae]SIS98621.1 Ca2+-transporting ATPase [Filimonas lacunae]
MTGNDYFNSSIQGLTTAQAQLLQQQWGFNVIQSNTSHRWLKKLWGTVKEPMFVLLSIACLLYFILGNTWEGSVMSVALLIISAISLYQEIKSDKAMSRLVKLSATKINVIRDGRVQSLDEEALVPGDIIQLEEGMTIPADVVVLQFNDLTINESAITGESLPVDKTEKAGSNKLYQGTTINSGKCVARVTATGNHTVLGKVGKAVMAYHPAITPLQRQVNTFVKRMSFFGMAGFAILFFTNLFRGIDLPNSLLFALTLAMSAIPEEIPVAFSSFMALGAYKLSKRGIICRRPQMMESLGEISVLCFDKTGTLTQNEMEVAWVYDHATYQLVECTHTPSVAANVIRYAKLASEQQPFDAMEIAIGNQYLHYNDAAFDNAAMIHEYPLGGTPPMMTHVYTLHNQTMAAAKGAVERIIRVCKLSGAHQNMISGIATGLANKGCRVLGVAYAVHDHQNFPENQDDYHWQLAGLLALYDPPKPGVASSIAHFTKAGIAVKMLTGDHGATAVTIGKKVGISQNNTFYTGQQVMDMDEDALNKAVQTEAIFARMFPEAKLRVITALKKNGQLIGMTGDGVNDAPALQAADIGIAMGRRGTGTAQQAADLIVTDDQLEHMVTAIEEGRKVLSNFKKALRYILSIHIPIILTAAIPVIAGWQYANVFGPVHVIFLELIMGPTCSLFFENEPAEEGIMHLPPIRQGGTIMTKREMAVSVSQGLVIASTLLGTYYVLMQQNAGVAITRTMVFITLLLCNLFLTFVNRSFVHSFFTTLHYKNNLIPVIVSASLLLITVLLFIPPVQHLFMMTTLNPIQIFICIVLAFISISWIEVYKKIRRYKTSQ